VVRLSRFGLSRRHRLGLEPQRHKGARRSDCTPRELYRALRATCTAVLVAVDEDHADDLRMALLNQQLIALELVRRLERDKSLKVVEDQGLEILRDRVLDRVSARLDRILDAYGSARSGEGDAAPAASSA